MASDGDATASRRRQHVAPPAPRAADLAMLVVMTFCAFECLLLAAAFRGTWIALAVPGLVCAGRAWTIWNEAARRTSAGAPARGTRVARAAQRMR